MKKKITVLTILAAGSALLHIWAEYRGPEIQIYVFKPLTMVFIILVAAFNTKHDRSLYSYAVMGGLFCSIAGDVFLMLPSDPFVAGLISFLFAHLFYIIAFTYKSHFRFPSWSLIPFSIYGLFIYLALSPYLGEMKLPVLIYIVVILFMGWRAWQRLADTRSRYGFYAFCGALLFIFSDSILAFNKFQGQFDAARAVNLSAYFAAQWLIAQSIGNYKADRIKTK